MERFVGHKGVTFLESVLDGMVDMVRVVDQNHKIVLANRRMTEVFGPLQGKDCYGLHSDSPCEDCIVTQAMRTRKSADKLERVDGRVYSVVASPLSLKEQETPWCVEVWRDITDQQRDAQLLAEYSKRLQEEMEYARRVQHTLLPRIPHVPGYGFYGLYESCEELSGDMYDLFLVGEDTLMFYVADVSGHGVSAAMLTVFLVRLARTCFSAGWMPSQALEEITRRFEEMGFDEELYITVFAVKLKISTGEFWWCNAGHGAAPLYKSSSDAEPSPLLMNALPICRWGRRERRIDQYGKLEKGGKILLYTDGVPAMQEKLGEANSLSLMMEATPPEMMNTIKDQIARSGTLKDDAAFLLVCRE